MFQCHRDLPWEKFKEVHPSTKLMPPAEGEVKRYRCNAKLRWHQTCPILHKAIEEKDMPSDMQPREFLNYIYTFSQKTAPEKAVHELGQAVPRETKKMKPTKKVSPKAKCAASAAADGSAGHVKVDPSRCRVSKAYTMFRGNLKAHIRLKVPAKMGGSGASFSLT